MWVIIWNIVALSVNTLSIFVVYYEAAFRLKAITQTLPILTFFEVILMLDVLFIFLKARPKSDGHRGWICPILGLCRLCKEDKKKPTRADTKKDASSSPWQQSFKLNAIGYLSNNFIIDFLSVFPFFIGKLAYSGTSYFEMIEDPMMSFFAFLRLLRISFLPKILNASDVYAHLLMRKFPSKRQVIFNGKQIFSLILFLLLSLHLSACFNIFSGTGEDSWIPLDVDGRPSENTPIRIYTEQIYFMTTTTTTIGYGDFNADKSNEKSTNMTVIMMLQLLAIFSFTLIRDKIFSLQFDVKLSEIIQSKREEVELFLFDIDLAMKRQSEILVNLGRVQLPDQIYEDSINSIETMVKFSPFEDF